MRIILKSCYAYLSNMCVDKTCIQVNAQASFTTQCNRSPHWRFLTLILNWERSNGIYLAHQKLTTWVVPECQIISEVWRWCLSMTRYLHNLRNWTFKLSMDNNLKLLYVIRWISLIKQHWLPFCKYSRADSAFLITMMEELK